MNLDEFQKACLTKPKRKSPGSPRYQHLRFFRLAVGERLDINLVSFKKVGAFSAQNTFTGALRRVMPWDKVRSRRPVILKSEAEKVAAFMKGSYPWPETIQRSDAVDSAALALHDFNIITAPSNSGMGCQGDGGDRTPESIGGNEKTPSA